MCFIGLTICVLLDIQYVFYWTYNMCFIGRTICVLFISAAFTLVFFFFFCLINSLQVQKHVEVHVQGCIQKLQTESIMKYMHILVVCFCSLQSLWKGTSASASAGTQFSELHM
jgi:hypothetical protein